MQQGTAKCHNAFFSLLESPVLSGINAAHIAANLWLIPRVLKKLNVTGSARLSLLVWKTLFRCLTGPLCLCH